MPATLTAAQMLAKHREIWDMPRLAEEAPEILQHLSERYEVHFGICSDVIVLHKATRQTEAMLDPETGLPTTDVRVAVATLLQRETTHEIVQSQKGS